MSGLPDSVRMVCPNPDCINKSIVYRKIHKDKIQVCKKCGVVLTNAKRAVDYKNPPEKRPNDEKIIKT